MNIMLKSKRHLEKLASISRFVVGAQKRADLDSQRIGKVQRLQKMRDCLFSVS
jgi:hypothetical protein